MKDSNKLSFKLLLGIFVSWIAVVVFGFVVLVRYAGTSGSNDLAPKLSWPSATSIPRTEKPSLVIFAHPHCPCSKATVGELNRLMPFLKDKVDVTVLFLQPESRTLAWVEDSLWTETQNIANVKMRVDHGGREADLFGATTSGQVFLYDTNGELVFSGGITPARGHMGDSQGRDFILSWVHGEPQERKIIASFGCSLK